VHHDRLIFDVRLRGDAAALRDEVDGSSDAARWVAPDELAGLPVMTYAAAVLGVPVQPVTYRPTQPPAALADAPARAQRFGAYALVTDPAGRILLTRIAPGYPGGGRWHLPGGGTDFGEAPAESLLRELHEETGQRGRVTGLLGVSHSHNPAALGPEGYPIDWHVVRVHYRAEVDEPTPPVVIEAAGGSTSAAAWFTRTEVAGLHLTGLATEVLSEQLT
jgi:ADP-ribose pyrophosphatase YjhB (NUDIX family)